MYVTDILEKKSRNVISTSPDQMIFDAAKMLHANRIGAVLALDDEGAVAGIISERDIIRGVAQYGPAVFGMQVRDLMTREVLSCSPSDSISQIMAVMTEHRIRHLPVVAENMLIGIISIGDVVKERLEEAAYEMESLKAYVAGQH